MRSLLAPVRPCVSYTPAYRQRYPGRAAGLNRHHRTARTHDRAGIASDQPATGKRLRQPRRGGVSRTRIDDHARRSNFANQIGKIQIPSSVCAICFGTIGMSQNPGNGVAKIAAWSGNTHGYWDTAMSSCPNKAAFPSVSIVINGAVFLVSFKRLY